MRNLAELQTALLNELKHWFKKQCENIHADFYLYYLPATAEHNGGLLICQNEPPNKEYKLVTDNKINKAATVEQNFNHFRRFLGDLPVLS